MRLYVVGMEGMALLADSLRNGDLACQVITDGREAGAIACNPARRGCVLCRIGAKEDIPVLLNVWSQAGRFPLMALGAVCIGGLSFLFAAPAENSFRPEAESLFKKVRVSCLVND